MNRSDLIEQIYQNQTQLIREDIEAGVKCIIEHMSEELANGNRIEIRGFGSYSLRYREPKMARNPRSGETVATPGKYTPHFKPGKELRERIDFREAKQVSKS